MIVDGKDYPLSAEFEAPADVIAKSYAELTTERDDLLRLSNDRHAFVVPTPKEPLAPGGTLTVAENDRLQAIVRTINAHHGARFLQGRDLAEFGFEGVDQVHGNAHHLECGCILHVVFDHHQRHAEPTLHPHYPRRSCDKHVHLLADFKAHHAQAHADNKAAAEPEA